MAKAIQVSENHEDGSIHAVGVGDLRVMIICENELVWYAQGLEIDYLAQGKDLEDVKASFEKGLTATISEHLRMYGDITELLVPAPAEVWKEFYAHATSDEYQFSQVTAHEVESQTERSVLFATTERPPKAAARRDKKAQRLPFRRIAYLEQQCA